MQANCPRVCVIGAGAIAGYFGGRLAQGHADVSVVARGRTLAALRLSGWTLESGCQRTASPVRATDDASSLDQQDVVIVAVKAYALAEVAPLIEPLLGCDTLILPALNEVPWWFTHGLELPLPSAVRSLDPTGRIAAAIPVDRVIGSVVYPARSSPEPGVTRHAHGSRLVFGEIKADTGCPSPRLAELVAKLRSAGFEAETTSDIHGEVWRKLLGNACFNPVSMLTGSDTDALIDDPDIHGLFTNMMAETLSVGCALCLTVNIQAADSLAVARKLGNIKTSMLQDADAGRPVEIDAILGAVNELANA